MARTSKKRKHVGKLSRSDLKELDALRKDPQRLHTLLQKLRSRAELGIASRSENDRLAMLEAFRVRVSQEEADLKSRHTDFQKLHEALDRDRVRDAKRPRSDRAIPLGGAFRIVSGGAPGLGRRR